MSSLDNLRKAARRWLKALRAGDPRARARLNRVTPAAPTDPALRDVHHALAREHGHVDWLSLRRAVDRQTWNRDLEQIDGLARDFLLAYRTGDAGALERLGTRFKRQVAWEALRAEVHQRLAHLPPGERPAGDIELPDVQRFIARSAGCETWRELVDALTHEHGATPRLERPPIPPATEDARSGMLHPVELRLDLPMELPEGVYSTTTRVWQTLVASKTGDLETLNGLVEATPNLARCEHNDNPPLHLAVREGHLDVVRYLVERRAYVRSYKTYPYAETLLLLAEDRGFSSIAALLRASAADARPSPDNTGSVHGVGHIDFPPDDDASRLDKLIGAGALHGVAALLDNRPDLVHNELAFYGEGVLAQAANRSQRPMLDLLMERGARVPPVAKWGRFYYFKHTDVAAVLLERGMNPNHMTWHRTTLLHDMAGEGNTEKAGLLLKHGADVNAVDDEFRSTPLGFAARWGRRDMVRLLLERGADPNVAGASWATALAWAEKKGHRGIAEDLRSAGAR